MEKGDEEAEENGAGERETKSHSIISMPFIYLLEALLEFSRIPFFFSLSLIVLYSYAG